MSFEAGAIEGGVHFNIGEFSEGFAHMGELAEGFPEMIKGLLDAPVAGFGSALRGVVGELFSAAGAAGPFIAAMAGIGTAIAGARQS